MWLKDIPEFSAMGLAPGPVTHLSQRSHARRCTEKLWILPDVLPLGLPLDLLEWLAKDPFYPFYPELRINTDQFPFLLKHFLRYLCTLTMNKMVITNNYSVLSVLNIWEIVFKIWAPPRKYERVILRAIVSHFSVGKDWDLPCPLWFSKSGKFSPLKMKVTFKNGDVELITMPRYCIPYGRQKRDVLSVYFPLVPSSLSSLSFIHC